MPGGHSTYAKQHWLRWYKWARWDRIRAVELSRNPLCARCYADGRLTPAAVVHHNPPHQGDEASFWTGPFETLCKPCHDGPARREELAELWVDPLGPDGWPTDPQHPANRETP